MSELKQKIEKLIKSHEKKTGEKVEQVEITRDYTVGFLKKETLNVSLTIKK